MHGMLQLRFAPHKETSVFRLANVNFDRSSQDRNGCYNDLIIGRYRRLIDRKQSLREVSALRIEPGRIESAPATSKQERVRVKESPMTCKLGDAARWKGLVRHRSCQRTCRRLLSQRYLRTLISRPPTSAALIRHK